MQKVHLIGNAHLDPVWLWQWQEGFAEIKATYRSALDRMKEFDDFVFTTACGAYYMWIEKSDPAMFAEIQDRVKEGRWKLVGGWFIQPDCNIPSGESFARHALVTQRYFQEKFGVMAETGYNVDSFGHNGNIPMILKNSRMKNYVFMRPGTHEKDLPQNLFWWESRDGSRVPTYRIPFHYNLSKNEQYELFGEIANLVEEQGTGQMAFYGIGNHGGGPTVALLNLMHEILDDRFVYSDPNSFFAAQELDKLPVVRDDLQYHAKGCYSAMSEIKANNRRAENALIRAEKFSVLSEKLMGTPYPKAELDRAWKNTMFNQFHDILDGCAIRESYDDARDVHGYALATTADVENYALQQISWNINTLGDREVGSYIPEELAEEIGYPVVVFNPHPYPVTGKVYVRASKNHFYQVISDNDGNVIPMQTVRDSKTNRMRKYARLFEATLPAFGYRVYRMYHRDDDYFAEYDSPFTVTENSIENKKIKITFDPATAELCSMIDLESGKELLGGASRIGLYNDRKYDTWAHEIESFKDERPMKIKGTVSVTEAGPVRATVRTEQSFGKSKIIRDYSIMASGNEVVVNTVVDFHEKFRILKFEHNVNAQNAKAICKIPFGAIERPTDGTEQVCGDWIALYDANNGLAIATDSKHSFDADGSKLSFTVLRSPIYADHFAGKNRDRFCEFMEQGIQRFSYTLFPYKGEADAEKHASELQNPFVSIVDTFHRGPLAPSFEGMQVSAGNVIVTAIKQQFEGNGLILRCYEAEDRDTDCTIKLFDTSFSFRIPHSGVKTFLIKDGKATETDFVE